MRVAQVFLKYPPGIGGHEVYVQNLAEGLAARGVQVSVITSDLKRHGDPFERLEGAYDQVNGISVTRLKARQTPLIPYPRLPGLKEAILATKPDLIHAHGIWYQPFQAAVEAAVEVHLPLVLNPVFQDRSEHRIGVLWNLYLRRVARLIPQRAQILFNTAWEQEALARLGITFQHTDFLPPSLDLAELSAIPTAAVPGLLKEDLPLVFIGRVSRSKGVDLLIPAFAAMLERLRHAGRAELASRATLHIAGFRDTGEDFDALCRQHQVAEKVHFHYDAPRAELVNLLRRAALFVFPSRFETFGIAVTEAWAMGVLPLVSDCGALPYLVNDGHDGLVFKEGKLAERMAEGLLLFGSDKARSLVAAGRDKVETHYSRQGQIHKLLSIYRRICPPEVAIPE